MDKNDLETLILGLPTSAVSNCPAALYRFFTDAHVPGLSVRQLRSLPNQDAPFRDALQVLATTPTPARRPRKKRAKPAPAEDSDA